VDGAKGSDPTCGSPPQQEDGAINAVADETLRSVLADVLANVLMLSAIPKARRRDGLFTVAPIRLVAVFGA
jgi:hypothetical protein